MIQNSFLKFKISNTHFQSALPVACLLPFPEIRIIMESIESLNKNKSVRAWLKWFGIQPNVTLNLLSWFILNTKQKTNNKELQPKNKSQ